MSNAKSNHYAVLVAHASGEISEGMASKTLGIDRVTLREEIADAIALAKKLERRRRDSGATVKDDLASEAALRGFRHDD